MKLVAAISIKAFKKKKKKTAHNEIMTAAAAVSRLQARESRRAAGALVNCTGERSNR